MALISGTITALITPFIGDQLDEQGLVNNVRDQLGTGVSALVVAGSTGEEPALTHEERRSLIHLTVETVKGKIPVIVGCGTNNTRTTIEQMTEAKALHADMALIVLPYYNRPTQQGLIEHVEAIAKAVDIPIILYNHPGRTGVNLLPESLAHLAKIPTVVGLKDCSGSLAQVSQYLAATPRASFSLFSGDDNLALPYMALGARGIISVVSNLVPERMVELTNTLLSGNLSEAQRLHFELLPLFEASSLEVNPMPIKAMMQLCGKPSGRCRLPLCEVTNKTRQQLEQTLEALNLNVVGSC